MVFGWISISGSPQLVILTVFVLLCVRLLPVPFSIRTIIAVIFSSTVIVSIILLFYAFVYYCYHYYYQG